ncbi:MAG: hypothetical protein K2N32_05995, partial [Clostridia bacterium]|nr:hypothetical protein [Clostridia bacterium]
MDYSNYYLKNYYKNRNGNRDSEPVEQKVLDESREERQSAVGDIYDDSQVEIEVVPQLTSMVQTNYEIGDDDDAIIDILPQSYDRQDSKRKSWIMSLAIITCLLLTVVIGDFATNGALLARVSSLYRTQATPKSGFYAIVLKSSDSYSNARIYADQIRLIGGAGYMVKSGEKYLIVGDVYDDLSEANAVVDKNEGSQLISYEIEEIDFEKIFSDNSPLMQSMGGYSVAIVNQLAKIGESLSTQQIDRQGATDQIENIRDNLQIQFDTLSAESESENPIVKTLLSDVN